MEKIFTTKIQMRNDTLEKWELKNPVLGKGEIGFIIDKNEIKVGNGISKFTELKSLSSADLVLDGKNLKTEIAGKDYVIPTNTSLLEEIEKVKKGYVENSKKADGLLKPLPFEQVVTGLGNIVKKEVGTNAGNIPILNEKGKLFDDVIPDLAITNSHVVASLEEMLKLNVQEGDFAIRTDMPSAFILSKSPASKIENWIEFKFKNNVLSVNDKVGNVTLSSDDILEGSKNLYFSEDRFIQIFNENKAELLKDYDIGTDSKIEDINKKIKANEESTLKNTNDVAGIKEASKSYVSKTELTESQKDFAKKEDLKIYIKDGDTLVLDCGQA